MSGEQILLKKIPHTRDTESLNRCGYLYFYYFFYFFWFTKKILRGLKKKGEMRTNERPGIDHVTSEPMRKKIALDGANARFSEKQFVWPVNLLPVLIPMLPPPPHL